MRRGFACWFGAVSMLGLAVPTAGAATFGAFGDSLTDEYLGQRGSFGATDLPAMNWVQLLVTLRGLDFGAFEADPSVRGEPQNEGYAYNWARSGATAMAPGLGISNLAQQVATASPTIDQGEVEIVYVGIGSNDYFLRDFIQKKPFVGPDYDQFEADLLDSIFTAVDRLQANDDVSIILGELPLGTAGGAGPGVVDAIAHLNTLLHARADALAIPVVDMWAWTRDPKRVDEDGALLFDGHRIPIDSVASIEQTVPEGTPGAGPCDSSGRCATLAYALNAIASDRIHPNTILQAMLANEFIAAVNDEFDLDIKRISDDEVVNLVPEPATALFVGLGLAALGLRRRHAPRS